MPEPVIAWRDNPVADFAKAQQATQDAHAAYLRFAHTARDQVAATLAFQTALLERFANTPVDMTVVPAWVLDRARCLEFAVGSIGAVLGPDFAEIDHFPTRVRLPDEPLMLVDRITALEGTPRSLTRGRVVTEHDVLPGAWYLDGGRIPTSIAVESGQADLFLSGYLGIDFITRGLAVYRLLDAVVTFHRELPRPGSVIVYDIHIDHFFRQGDTHLFRFRFEGTVDGEPLLTMTEGCAGFFSAAALASGKGIVHTELDRRTTPGTEPDDRGELPACVDGGFDSQQIDALRRGDLAGCFGPLFAGMHLGAGLRLPAGRLQLVDRVTRLEARGGRFGIGFIRGEHDIDPRAWFLTCHFVDDRVMPGTLMYECCLHTLRIFLLRLGWVTAADDVVTGPVPGVASRLKCRGQVTETTRTVAYEVTLKERGYRPEPYVLCDALMYADGKPIVEIVNMSLRMVGLDRAAIRRTWDRATPTPPTKPLFDTERILAFAIGKPSEAFGEPYRIFDAQRRIARLPGPPYQFLDRITAIEAEPWKMVAGGTIEAQYDVPPDAWYFAADRQATMPFAVLLEVALQPCGWLAAYLGSALTSPIDLSFRNLGGSAQLHEAVRPDCGTLTTQVRITRVSSSAGMIIQGYSFNVRRAGRVVYEGDTTFGFFSQAALAQQVGLREAAIYQPSAAELAGAESLAYPVAPPFPDERWRMIDTITTWLPNGGPRELGFVQGTRAVRPEEWFFKAHFYQDPVVPGSLGLESLLQLLKVAAIRRWGEQGRFAVMTGGSHRWLYRGQVVPTHSIVTVTALVTACDDSRRMLTADGFLAVDNRAIYQMNDFTLGMMGDGI